MKKIIFEVIGILGLFITIAYAALPATLNGREMNKFTTDVDGHPAIRIVLPDGGGGGGGGGGVSNGIAGYFAYYATTGTTVSGQSALFTDGTNIGIGTATPNYLLDVNGIAHFSGSGGVTLDNGGAIRTDTTTGHTALLQAYNTGTVAYTSFATLTAGSTPTMDLSASTTIGSDTIVSRTGSQTLTNKTLTSPIFSTISNTGTITLPTSTDTLVGRATTDTLTNKTLTSPKIGTSILDTNGANLFTYTAGSSAVNYLNYGNGTTGTDPTYTVTGDANRGITYTMAGTGGVTITSTNTGPSTIKRGLTVNNDSNNGAGDDLVAKTANQAAAFQVDASADQINVAVPIATSSTLTSSATADFGWTIVDGTDNTACTAQCTSAAIMGFNITAGNITGLPLGPSDATADMCLCAGSS